MPRPASGSKIWGGITAGRREAASNRGRGDGGVCFSTDHVRCTHPTIKHEQESQHLFSWLCQRSERTAHEPRPESAPPIPSTTKSTPHSLPKRNVQIREWQQDPLCRRPKPTGPPNSPQDTIPPPGSPTSSSSTSTTTTTTEVIYLPTDQILTTLPARRKHRPTGNPDRLGRRRRRVQRRSGRWWGLPHPSVGLAHHACQPTDRAGSHRRGCCLWADRAPAHGGDLCQGKQGPVEEVPGSDQ